MHLLSFLTDFGDPFLTVPLALAIQCWLIGTRQWRAARCWAAGFVCGAGLVALTKFVYAGWNIGIAVLHFTGVSGHAMLSTAVYPVAAAICANGASPASVRRSMHAGLVFSLAVGVSRVAFGYHSWSEVVSGWLVGGYVATFTMRFLLQRQPFRHTRVGNAQYGQTRAETRAASPPERRPAAQRQPPERPVIPRRSTAMFAASLIVITLLCHGRVAPVSAWISRIGPGVAGWVDMLCDDSHWRAPLPTGIPFPAERRQHASIATRISLKKYYATRDGKPSGYNNALLIDVTYSNLQSVFCRTEI